MAPLGGEYNNISEAQMVVQNHHPKIKNLNQKPVHLIEKFSFVLLGLTIVSGYMLSYIVPQYLSNSASALIESTQARATVSVEAACYMTATVNTAHTTTVLGGSYTADIGKTTIQTICNDANGYAIYAVGYTNDTMGNTKLHSAALGNSYDIATGTATSGTPSSDVSNWAMKLSSVTGIVDGKNQIYAPTILNGYDNYSAVPATYTKVASFNSNTDSGTGSIGSSLTTTYAAYISPMQPAGTYVGQVKYALVHPASTATSTYTMQEVDTWANTLLPDEQVVALDNRDGHSYTVAKLCVEKDVSDNCTKSQIWMTENLDLLIGGTYNGEPIVLDSTNTDLNKYDMNGDGTGTTFAGYSTSTVDGNTVITWTPVGNTVTGTPATINFSAGTMSGWGDNSYTTPSQAEGGTYINRQGTSYPDSATCQAQAHTTDADCAHYYVGNYYNWTAAVAMNNTSAWGNSSDLTVMPNSICPKGWRLPNGLTDSNGGHTTADTASDFNYLLKAYNITGTGGTNGIDLTGNVSIGWSTNGYRDIGLAPLYFVHVGGINASTLGRFGADGNYWSSTVKSGTVAYGLNYSSSVLYPAGQNLRGYGRSVRCLAR